MRARVDGTVQGVGFRPFVYRLAREEGLAGFVLNDSRGVLLEVEGPAASVHGFLERLPREAPPLAAIGQVRLEERLPRHELSFTIAKSPQEGAADASVTPDSATCPECLAELLDPGNRRFRYPFINCTNCGPRFTIVRGVPYDRPLTTMAGFQMCERCSGEYEDPGDRRFHAQPNACPECGPSLSLIRADGRPVPLNGLDAVQMAALALALGRIVAVKGIGGVHLACDARSEHAVSLLRSRKHREDRPFAVMVASVQDAERVVAMGALGRELLCSRERPIVLSTRREHGALAPSLAPGVPELGVMLPYTPLHHLLLRDFAETGAGTSLVMTSGNVSDEPIVFRDEELLDRLAGIADLILAHDRPIQTRTDDSVVRAIARPGRSERQSFVRRSRGYVPASIPLPDVGEQPILACGAELKNTFCIARGGRAWVGHHIGDLENFETLRSFIDGIEHFERLFEIEPQIVAHDLHPEYLSTKHALELDGVALVGVQHHHAHLAACLAEHGESGRAIGAIFDGSGYGTDGTIWGGELLAGDIGGFRRVGMLRPVRLPGGSAAIRQPWRMACAWLAECGEPATRPSVFAGRVQPGAWLQVQQLLRTGVASPATSSMGRLFDAVGAICGLRATVNYEGQAAIELEAACDASERAAYPIDVRSDGSTIEIDPRETVRAVLRDAGSGRDIGRIAARFHAAVSAATVRACAAAAQAQETDLVVLGGGVFQNRRLLEAVDAGLAAYGLRVLIPEKLPIGDGGISYGQAAVAARLQQRGCCGDGPGDHRRDEERR